MEPDSIFVKGAREHNLKGITLDIPKKKLVVFTGVSGSGKSSLAFDTLYAEGQRRYVESLSAYARQFLGQMEKPHYDVIRGLSPTISIEQKAAGSNPRSTVGTITEIHDYLRVLYASIGKQHCSNCGRKVGKQSAQQIAAELGKLPEAKKSKAPEHELQSIYSEHLSCPVCGISFPELQPSSFSFNNPLGMCTECNGLGSRPEMDPELVIPDTSKTVRNGAVEPWNHALERGGGWTFRMIESL